MSNATTLRRDAEEEARLIEEARLAMRQGRFIADADVDHWLEEWSRGRRPAVPEGPVDGSASR